MGRVEEILIPSRFLLTCGHFITAILAFYNTPTNVAAGYPSGGSASQLSLGRASILTALVIAMMCFVVQFVGLFGGYTMFRNSLNLFHCVMQFFGGVLTAWYLIDSWGFLSYWCVCVCFLPPAGGGSRGMRGARMHSHPLRRQQAQANPPILPCHAYFYAAPATHPLLTHTTQHTPLSLPPSFFNRPLMIVWNLIPSAVEALNIFFALQARGRK
jgi:hypothetical protein